MASRLAIRLATPRAFPSPVILRPSSFSNQIPRSTIFSRSQPSRPLLKPLFNSSPFNRRFQSTNTASAFPTPPNPVDGDSIKDVIFEQLSSGASPPVAVPHIGYLRELGVDFGWGPTTIIQYGLEAVHVFLGGPPWWVTICASVVVFRMLLLPMFARQSSQAAKLGEMAPRSQELREEMNQARARKDSAAMQLVTRQLRQEYKERGISFVKLIASPIIQGVVGFGVWRIGWRLSEIPELGLSHSGLLWLTDLTVPDPFYIISLLVVGIGHITGRLNNQVSGSSMPQLKNVFLYVLPALMGWILSFQPAMVGLVIALNAGLTLAQTLLFRIRGLRAWWGMAPLPPRRAPDQPGKGIWQMVKDESKRQQAAAPGRRPPRKRDQVELQNTRIDDVQKAKAYETKLAATRMRRQQRERNAGQNEDKF